MTGKATEADALVQKALAGATAKAMQGVTVNTAGNLGHAVSLTMDTGHSLDFANKRWGVAGINYMSNLVAAGQAEVAAILPTLPTYSQSAVVAAKNMSGMALNEKGLNAQLQALAADLNNPFMVHNASSRAMRQAAEARVADLTEAGALPQIAAAQKNVDSARQTALDAQAAYTKAVRNAQGARAALMAAQAAFDQKPADTAAMDAVMDAIGSVENANQAGAQARLAYQSNQKALIEAQTKLDDVQHKTLASVQAQVKQEIAQLRRKQEGAGLNRQTVLDRLLSGFVAAARAEEKVNPLTGVNTQMEQASLENVSNDSTPLAQTDGSGIMESVGAQTSAGVLTLLDKMDNESILKIPWEALRNNSLPSLQVRHWYVVQVLDIPNKISQDTTFYEKVYQAFEWRNRIKRKARDIMVEKDAREMLELTRPIKSFEELLISKMERKGMTREEALQDIYDTATKTNESVNYQFGVER